MAEPNIAEALRSLRRSLKNLKALLEWSKLVREHRKPHQPPAFRIDRGLQQEMRTEYSFFIKTAMEVRQALRKGQSGDSETRRRHHRRLKRLEEQFRKLELPIDL